MIRQISDLAPKDALERIYNSQEYRDLNKSLSESNARFRDLKPSVKLIATYLLNLGQVGVLEDLWRLFYRGRPIGIDDYLSVDILGDVYRQMYPIWKRDLSQIFSQGSVTNEYVIGGAIGTGKTTVARIGQIYNLQNVLNLQHPQLSLGNATPDTTLVLALFTVTLEKATLAVLQPFRAILEQCPLFQEVKKTSDFLDFSPNDPHPYVDEGRYLQFPRNIMVYTGSQVSHALSFSMFGALLDEAEFRRESLDEAFAVYANLKERVRSRFLGSRFTFLCLVSSAKYARGVIAEYTQGIEADPHAIYTESAIWDVKHFDAYDQGHFYVLRGTQSHPSRILDEIDTQSYDAGDYPVPPSCKIIKVPNIYRRDFERRIEEALRNLAGEQTISADYLFDDLTHAQYDFLLPEFRIEAPMSGEVPLLQKLPREIWTDDSGDPRLARYPQALRYLHIDLAEAAEAGICMLHKEIDGTKRDGEDVSKYVIDFVAWITSPDRINIHSVEQLVIDLAVKRGVSFAVITTDQYQSSAMRQMFENLKIATEVKHQSVDRKNDQKMAYLTASNLSTVRAIAMGRSPKAVKQLEDVQFMEGDIVTPGRKDMADAIAGALKNAAMQVRDQPAYPFVDLRKEVDKAVPDGWERM